MRSVVKALLMAIGVTAVAMPALAHDHGWKHRHHRHHHGFGPRAVVVERPVVVVPARPAYYEMPMYYGPPPPPSININIPLR